MAESAASGSPSAAPSVMSAPASPTPAQASFPPYPPYTAEPAPPSVADTIMTGRDIRRQHKSVPRKSVRPVPNPAKPRGPKATDVKMSRRMLRAHARCLRRHGAVLTDRLERMAKPRRRNIIYLWRENAHLLAPETIGRLRSMLDADEPFKPDQAYEYFINLRKSKKKNAAIRVNQIKKDVMALCGDKRFVWARNATVAFARGIQQRLSRPGCYALADGMLRLSDIILDEICGLMRTRAPSRKCRHPKARFMMEMADKVAVWIDEILTESEDRMLMMDFDEDDDILRMDGTGDARFADDFLNMMGDGGLLKGPQSAYLKFTGEMLEAFMILTDSMNKQGDTQLLTHGKFTQTYREAADELKRTPDFDATDFYLSLAEKINTELNATVKPDTPAKIAPYMKDVVEICSNFLAQHAEHNKDKGPAFKLLVKTMKSRSGEELYQKEKAKRNNGEAAKELEASKGMETDHDDPNLSQEIHSKLSKLTDSITPNDLKEDMKDTLDVCSKYLSQRAIDEIERGPSFDLLIHELEKDGAGTFSSSHPDISTKFATAYVLKTAPGFTSIRPDPAVAPTLKKLLHRAVDPATPKPQQQDMAEVIDRCGNYLSGFIRDRGRALKALLDVMKANSSKELVTSNDYTMSYKAAASDIEAAPMLIPYLHVKDISEDGKQKLTAEMEGKTPNDLKIPMKSVINDASKHISQGAAVRSKAGGARYALNLLAAVKKSLGSKRLFKYLSYGQTYSDAADVLKYAGPLEKDTKHGDLKHRISAEMKVGVPKQLAFTIAEDLHPTMETAAQHLAKVGGEKGDTLEHLVKMMNDKGEAPLGHLQGYDQTYKDGARRIENSSSLTNEKVDKGAYEAVRGKLTQMVGKPKSEDEKYMPAIIEESAKFLAAPLPETDAEKRHVLGDLMGRKGDEVLNQDGPYKVTYQEAGEDIAKAPVGVTTSSDPSEQRKLASKLNAVVPDKKLQEVLKDPINEGSAYLTDVVKGRGEAMKVIQEGLKQEKSKELLNVGKFHATQGKAADMLSSAPHFGGQNPSPVIQEVIAERLESLPKDNASERAKEYMAETTELASQYIAGVATTQSGLNAGALAALDPKSLGAEGSSGANGKAGGRGSKSGLGGIFGGSGRDAMSPAERARYDAEQRRNAISPAERARYDAMSPAERARYDAEQDRLNAMSPAERAKYEAMSPAERAKYMAMSPAERAKYEAEKAKRDAEEEARRNAMSPAERARYDAENKRRMEADARRGGGIYDDDEDDEERRLEQARLAAEAAEYDPEREAALAILHKQLRKRGSDVLYSQPHTELTHKQASEWIAMKPPMKVDKTVKESGDTARLHKKFERKLGALVSKVTPAELNDNMQDVIVESSRIISEYFVSNNYKALVKEALISGMQKRGNELLVDSNNDTETFFFAAQRLKKAKSLEVKQPCAEFSYYLAKKLDEGTRCRSMVRKLTATMKDHIKDAADYLSEWVTKPDDQIEAYVALLGEMEAAGDTLLIEGSIPKTYKDAAAYLRELTSCEDQIRRSNCILQSNTASKLKHLMANVVPRGYTNSVLDDVISDCTKLLVSYIMLQGEKTEALKLLIAQMEQSDSNVLLRHGSVRKTYGDGARLLRGKNTDQLGVNNVDPVVVRKIEIKLKNLATLCIPERYSSVVDDVVDDTTRFLAVHLLQPQVIQVCKCMKNVFVQCELWCEEMLRRVGRPCCACSRRLSAHALQDLAPDVRLRPGQPSSLMAPGLELALAPCPAQPDVRGTCPAPDPTPGCRSTPTTSYLMYSATPYDYPTHSRPTSESLSKISPSSPVKNLISDIYHEDPQLLNPNRNSSSDSAYLTPPMSPTTSASPELSARQWRSSSSPVTYLTTEDRSSLVTRDRGVYNTRTPIVSTDQMSDWHAMMVSLMWNVQAWRDWIQETIDRALTRRPSRTGPESVEDSWFSFQRRVSTEALQWRQYNNFSRLLTLRLSLRYKDKEIVSPTRATVKTQAYMQYQREMLDIIEMFNRWTRWLTAVVKETDSLQHTAGSDVHIHEMRWNHFKAKVEEYAEDWIKYNSHLKMCWEHRHKTIIADWLPSWTQTGPMWVVSACGAVPSGAVAAGLADGEVIWVARTTHRCNVLPAALHPSKHCCLVYEDGAVHRYTKYQVMCNADVQWVAWRAGRPGARAVRVARGVHAGRVLYRGDHLVGAVRAPHYRCHVIIFGRPFAFNCYELLVLTND